MRPFRLSRYSVAVLLCSTLALYGAPGQFNQTTPYTTVFSRQLLRTTDAAAARTLLEVGAGGGGTGDVVGANTLTNQMPLLGVGSKSIIATNLPGFRAAVGLTIGTDVQAFDADLGSLSSGITGLVKGAGNGSGYSAAVSGTDYAPPTSGTSILKGNGLGGFAAAVAGTDYLSPTGLDTSAEFRTLLGDESGSGSMVFQGGNIAAATATTPTANDNTARVATTEYVQTELLDYQGLDTDLNDLADGELTGSKVGAGINGNNITTGTVSPDRLPPNSLTQAGIVPAGTGNEGKIYMVDENGVPGFYVPDELPTGTLTVKTNMVMEFVAGNTNRPAILNGSSNLVASIVGASLPLDIKPTTLPSSTYARPDAGENCYRVLFAQNEAAIWQFLVPRNFNGKLQLDLIWKMQSATSGSVTWSAEVWAISPGDAADVNTQSFDTANTQSTSVPGTAGRLGATTVTCTNADSAAAGDFVQVRIKRTDALSGDAALVGLTVNYDVK
jgi:hypothetical protein